MTVKVYYKINDVIVHLYSGTIPETLYGHLVVFGATQASINVEMEGYPSAADNSSWLTNSNYIFYQGNRVGIGTSSPNTSYKLDVEGTINSANGNSIQWNEAYSQRGSMIAGEGLIWENGQLAVNQSSVWVDNSGSISYTGGAVGIGSSFVPSNYLLFVDGAVGLEELIVEIVPGTGPDYVFDDDYNLSSLESIDQFIKENKHLPEVPTAGQMESLGVNVGELNMILLKKIEELTLHLIELNKKYQNISLELKSLQNDEN